jgi:hypothetical protein
MGGGPGTPGTGKQPTFFRDPNGAFWIKGKGSFFQVVVAPNTDGGPLVVSTYAQATGEEKTFGQVTEATKYLKKAGAKLRDISRLRPMLYKEFKPFSSKLRSGTAGPFSGTKATSVDRTTREPMK